MATKAQLMKDIEQWRAIRDSLEEDLKAAKDQVVTLSATNFDLVVKVGKLEKAFLKKCLDELDNGK